MRLLALTLWFCFVVGAVPARGGLITLAFEGVIDQNTHVQTDGTVIDLSWFAQIGDPYHGFVTYDATAPVDANTKFPEWTYHLVGEPNIFSATINGQTYSTSTFDASNSIRFAPPTVDWWQSQFESRESMGSVVRATNLVLRDYDKQTVLDFDDNTYGTPTTGLDDWEWAEFSFMVEPLGLGVSGPLTRLSVVPEPSSLAMWSVIGLVGFGVGWRRRRNCFEGAKVCRIRM